MDYQQFLFYNLTQVVETSHPLKDMEYDTAYGELPKYHKEFVSQDNRDEIAEYEAIVNFLRTY